ncbi:hypothetical protein ABTZ44_16395 [Microbacterium oxydans]|uniref:hypothetical protein n=1 Tax=Microbacterium TaxID=33882 RepID=UPI00187D3BB9|nr:hypothetical protein [Microbacterium sp. R1]MBE7955372.1 hypothetical protein [Microbacterium sp. R1]
MARVDVRFRDSWNEAGHADPEDFVVRGEDGDAFLAALLRLLKQMPDPDQRFFSVVVYDANGDLALFAGLDDRVSIRQMERFAEGSHLLIDNAGRGGGLLTSMWEFVQAGLTLAGIVGLLQQGNAVYASALYRRKRRAAREWLVGGDGSPSLELTQMVNEHDNYNLRDFEGMFDLGPADAARLLREVGFVQEAGTPSDWPDLWVDPTE